MMKTSKPKHTPGPWHVYYDGDGCHVEFVEGPSVWDTTEDDEHSKNEVRELEANARLIAAAPELADEVRTLINVLELGAETPEDRELIIVHSKKVLAKATGGA